MPPIGVKNSRRLRIGSIVDRACSNPFNDHKFEFKNCLAAGGIERSLYFPVFKLTTSSQHITMSGNTTIATMVSIHEQKPRLSIPERLRTRLDPQWIELWEKHGSSMIRADELSIEEYRKTPANFAFTYPVCSGEFTTQEEIFGISCKSDRRIEQLEGPPVFHVEDILIPVTQPSGNITIRVYSPEGPGPFPVHLNFHGGMCSRVRDSKVSSSLPTCR